MRTLETTHAAPNLGAGTTEKIVPEGLKKLGRLAVWAASGSQFIDLIWHDDDEPSRQSGPRASARGKRLSQAELADLIRRAEPRRRAATPGC